ncbi:hypothetical protein L484_019361 [Morus notabilis]|uniref:Uncharacterized protein n=1 Tax=Morus notabilis TaxID=981085 RepID=W9RZV9_9ROSA|nr:hypothetical protein L484_019361 [Morus notabilis]
MMYWLRNPKAGTFEVFAQLPGFPDNIKRSPRGGFWAYTCLAKWRGRGLMIRLSEEGVVLDVLEDKSGVKWKAVWRWESLDWIYT